MVLHRTMNAIQAKATAILDQHGIKKEEVAPRRVTNPILAQIDADIKEFESNPSKFAELGQAPEVIWPGVCMTDIAHAVGLTIGGVSRIFNARRKARFHTLVSIANLYTDGSVQAVRDVIRTRVLKALKISDNAITKAGRDPYREEKLRILRLYEEDREYYGNR